MATTITNATIENAIAHIPVHAEKTLYVNLNGSVYGLGFDRIGPDRIIKNADYVNQLRDKYLYYLDTTDTNPDSIGTFFPVRIPEQPERFATIYVKRSRLYHPVRSVYLDGRWTFDGTQPGPFYIRSYFHENSTQGKPYFTYEPINWETSDIGFRFGFVTLPAFLANGQDHHDPDA